MKTELSIREIILLQYLCECAADDTKVELGVTGKLIAKRLSQVISNLALSKDNQVKVDKELFVSEKLQRYCLKKL